MVNDDDEDHRNDGNGWRKSYNTMLKRSGRKGRAKHNRTTESEEAGFEGISEGQMNAAI